MDTKEFCKELAKRISQNEWDALDRCDPSLTISDHNRETLLEMRALCTTSGATDGQTLPSRNVDLDEVKSLAYHLQSYLDEYMSDKPEGHKWIILASLYLAYVAHRPMHPINRTGIVLEEQGETTVYRCPLKVEGDNPICDACICIEK